MLGMPIETGLRLGATQAAAAAHHARRRQRRPGMRVERLLLLRAQAHIEQLKPETGPSRWCDSA